MLPAATLEAMSTARLRAEWASRVGAWNGRQTLLLAVWPGDDVVGFVYVRADTEDGPDVSGAERSGIGEVVAVHVARHAQGAGIGRRLLTEALRSLHDWGCRGAVLWVLRDNAPARAVYTHMGWRCDQVFRRELINDAPVDEVRYSIDLP